MPETELYQALTIGSRRGWWQKLPILSNDSVKWNMSVSIDKSIWMFLFAQNICLTYFRWRRWWRVFKKWTSGLRRKAIIPQPLAAACKKPDSQHPFKTMLISLTEISPENNELSLFLFNFPISFSPFEFFLLIFVCRNNQWKRHT